MEYVMNVDGTGLLASRPAQARRPAASSTPTTSASSSARRTRCSRACPPRPDPSKGYVWGLDPSTSIRRSPTGSDLRRLTNYGVYTAEAVVSPDGRRIVFTSLKDGDLDIYTMNVDGTDVRRLTTTPGYDGGPWWSPDGTQIAYRAWHPTDSALVGISRSSASGSSARIAWSSG
jgi:dipeptidyl aminopeptidase/acylaminoacyl peptidase